MVIMVLRRNYCPIFSHLMILSTADIGNYNYTYDKLTNSNVKNFNRDHFLTAGAEAYEAILSRGTSLCAQNP